MVSKKRRECFFVEVYFRRKLGHDKSSGLYMPASRSPNHLKLHFIIVVRGDIEECILFLSFSLYDFPLEARKVDIAMADNVHLPADG